MKETRCLVVLSSTWRLSKTWREDLEAQGLKTKNFIDRTPHIPRPSGTSVEYCERGKEVKAWLEKYKEQVLQYAIIDDDSDFLPEQPLFKTSWKNGLTPEIADKIIEHLNQKMV